MAAGDIDQNTLGTFEADFVEQRVCDRLLGSCDGAIFALRFAGAHHGLAHLVHHGAHVREIEVDQARTDHQVCHPFDALVKHVIGKGKCLGECRLFIGEAEQVLVWNDDQRIDDLLQSFNALFGLPHTLGALELERLGHDAHGEHAQLARGLRNDRRCAGARAAAHAGCDEAHMCADEMVDDFFDRLFSSEGPDSRARPGTQPFGGLRAHLDAGLRPVLLQCLRIGVGHDKFNPVELFVDHVVDCVAARATNAKNGNTGLQLFLIGHLKIECHVISACLSCSVRANCEACLLPHRPPACAH